MFVEIRVTIRIFGINGKVELVNDHVALVSRRWSP